MWKKTVLVSAVGLLLCAALVPTGMYADNDVQLQKPDTLRVPPMITLLASTPFYNSLDDLDTKQEGLLAPQEGVVVLAGQVGWSRGKSVWKIQTWQGGKYISPDPWDVDVPAPKKLLLFQETPIYASKNAKLKPSATLSPQEVQVVGAESQWFYSNNGDEDLKWIQIHTTWLGDQWLQLPVSKIGYVKPADEYAYYSSGWIMPTPEFIANTYHPDRYNVPLGLKNQIVHVTGEFVTPYDTNYQIQTEHGPMYVTAKGTPISQTTESTVLKSQTPLFSEPFGDRTTITTMLSPQTVSSFEKFTDMKLYHVHTELGDGWVDPYYAEPVDAKPTQVSIELKGETQLYQLPMDRLYMNGSVLTNQTVKPSQTWIDDQQHVWYQLQTKDGNAWFMFNPGTDRLVERDGGPLAQLTYEGSNLVPVTVEGDRLSYGVDVGYLKGDQPYLSDIFLCQSLQFILDRESVPDAVIFTHKDGYSFRIYKGKNEAVTFWKGVEQEKVKLHEAPNWTDDQVYLHSEDASLLMGAAVDWFKNRSRFYLFTDDYHVNGSNLPAEIKGSSLRLAAHVYDRTKGWYEGQPSLRPHFAVTNRSLPAATPASFAKEEEKETLRSWFAANIFVKFEQSQTITLQQGNNQLHAAIQIGKRILWQQDYTVTGTGASASSSP
ncbi:hypothetical protein [Paenibacillus sp. SI8]|uniref:hypothetical protein n=1 Tax=unclassified Paenibacillus TaxID=185978 RepID=UPI0034658EAD